jgi:hypothetical protein
MENPEMVAKYWMDSKDAVGDKLNTLVEEKRKLKSKIDVDNVKVSTNSENPIIKTLVAFHDLPTLPDELKAKFKNENCNLGDWVKASFEEAGINQVTKDIANHMEKNRTWLGYTQVTWRQLYMDPIFATFIARLFQNSFKTNVVKQNFSLTHKSKYDQNLLKLIFKFVGKQAVNEILDEGGLNIFNSSSVCSNLLNSLMVNWKQQFKLKRARRESVIGAAYKSIINKIVNRRSAVDLFNNQMDEVETRIFERLTDEEVYQTYEVPLQPLVTHINESHKATHKHLQKKYKNVKSLHIDSICRSLISVQSLFTQLGENDAYADIYGTIKPLKKINGVCWDTLASRKESLKFVKLNRNVKRKLKSKLSTKKLESSQSVEEQIENELPQENYTPVSKKQHPLSAS